MNLAANLARLRRERGMTQEALAEGLGVSAQTISKWENSTTCPDVALLPVLADVFGVTIDALYGREVQRQTVSPENAIDQVIDAVRRTIVGTVYNPEQDGPFEKQLDRYIRAMQSDVHTRSVIENDRDLLYFREALGALALRKPEQGWNSLFAREDVAEFLRLLAEEDFRRAMQTILQRRMLTFTLPSLMKQCGAKDAAHLEQCLLNSRCFARRELTVDEAPLVYYELFQGESLLYLVYAIYAFAQEFADYRSVHYCFVGNSHYFTP